MNHTHASDQKSFLHFVERFFSIDSALYSSRSLSSSFTFFPPSGIFKGTFLLCEYKANFTIEKSIESSSFYESVHMKFSIHANDFEFRWKINRTKALKCLYMNTSNKRKKECSLDMNNTTYLIYLILDIVAWIKKKLIQILCLSYTCDIYWKWDGGRGG